MRRALPFAALLAAGCALQSFTVAQPYFRTMEIHDAYGRAVKAVADHCGPISAENPDANVVVGAWKAWHTPDGVTLTQCIVTVLPDDEYSGNVRITFAARECPLSDLADLDALAATCDRTDSVRQLVNTGLTETSRKLEADIRR